MGAVQHGRMFAVAKAPYFAAAIHKLPWVVDDDITSGGKGTSAITKGGVVRCHSDVLKRPAQQIGTDLLHEIGHWLDGFFPRAAALGSGVNMEAANYAHDACVNERLAHVPGLDWGDMPPILPESLEQPPLLIFEERYRRLMQNAKKKKVEAPGGKKCCGTGSLGAGFDDKDEGGDQELSGLAQEGMRGQIARDIIEFANHNPGKIGHALVEWATRFEYSNVSWQEKLRRGISRAVASAAMPNNLSWRQPARRQGGVGYGPGRPVVPALLGSRPGVGVVIDTSGSMTEAMGLALGETQRIIRACGASIHAVACDTQADGPYEIRDLAVFLKSHGAFEGGGGTVLKPGFDAIATVKKIDVVVCLTDGGIWDLHEINQPKIPVLWGFVPLYDDDFTPPWGEKITIQVKKQDD